MNQLKNLGVRVIFEQEVLDTADTDNDLMISIIESIAQAENESRSENIKWGIKQHTAQGTSKLYNKKCYGYINDADGKLLFVKFSFINAPAPRWYIVLPRRWGV